MTDANLSPLFERLPIGVYRSTLDGRMLRANAALVQLNGYDSEAELLAAVGDIGREWYVDPGRRAAFEAQLAGEGRLIDFVSEVFRHRSRERIWVRESAYLVRDEQGQPLCYEGTVQDITTEHCAALALQDSERRFRALTDRAQVLTLLCTPGNRVLYASQAALTVLGREPRQLLGECVLDWMHPDDREDARLGFEAVVQRCNDGIESLYRLRHADGSWRYIAALGQDYMDDPAVAGIVLNYRDVTEREMALRAASASQQRFGSAFSASPNALVISRMADGAFVEFNDSFVALTGYRRDEMLDRGADELGLWADPQAHAKFKARFDRDGEVRQFVASFRARGGREVVVELSAVRVDEPGEPRVMTIARDITEMLATRLALEASEARLRLALKSANQGLYDLDLDSGRLIVSPEFATMLGDSAAELTDTLAAFYARLHPDDLPRVQQALDDCRQGRSTEFREEFRLRHRQGPWIGIVSQGRLIDAGPAGQPRRLLGTHTDISRRMQAEQGLRALADELERRVAERTRQLADSEQRYRGIFELVPMAIVEEDWSGVIALLAPHRAAAAADAPAWLQARPDLVAQCLQAISIERMNQAACELYGLPADGDAPQRLAQLFASYDSADSTEGFTRELAALLAGQRRLDDARSLRRADGEVRHMHLALLLPDLAQPGHAIALASLVDITELKRLSAELDASLTEARRANRELETFTYSVSHDLKAPLRGLDGYSQLLHDRCAHLLDDEGRAFLQRIRGAARQMAQLTDDLLAYARLERRPQDLHRLPLAALVRSVLAEHADELARRGVVPQVALPDLTLLADVQALRLALRNLVDNALKFSATAAQPALEIGADRQGGCVRLWVRDNGVGFDMNYHDRIFQIFQRLHRAEVYSGTGIGLAIVAKAMERMGGRAWADSAPGQGATFYLELPQA